MMKRLVFKLAVTLIIGACAGLAYGKGSPDQIEITNHRDVTIRINDREILRQFDPWGSQFIDWTSQAVSAPVDRRESYEVLFYLKSPGRHTDYDRGELKMIYAMRYVPSVGDLPGFIYLPGQGEKYHDYNVATIWRVNDDGKWHLASPSWDALMNRLLSDHRKPRDNFSTTFWFAIRLAVETCCV